jgi:precorrin-3B C17-methyltransferase
MAALQASGKSAAELAVEYRLPEDYIAALLNETLIPEEEDEPLEA